jgi:hypothetical protein
MRQIPALANPWWRDYLIAQLKIAAQAIQTLGFYEPRVYDNQRRGIIGTKWDKNNWQKEEASKAQELQRWNENSLLWQFQQSDLRDKLAFFFLA